MEPRSFEELYAKAGSDSFHATGCLFVHSALVEKRDGDALDGYGVHLRSGAKAIKKDTILLLESSISAEIPRYLHPRHASEMPSFLYALPLFLLPAAWRGDMVMRWLRVMLNSFPEGLYAAGSAVNHSCSPNACRVVVPDSGGVSGVVSVRPIKASEEITIPYVSTTLPRCVRRCLLYLQYGFWCRCRRCLGHEMPDDPLDVDQICADVWSEESFKRAARLLMARNVWESATSRSEAEIQERFTPYAIITLIILVAVYGSLACLVWTLFSGA